MAELYGTTNKIMSEINTHLLKHPEFLKFLYYTSTEYKTKDILAQPKVSSSKIHNKKFFVFRRIPESITTEDAFVFIDVYRDMPTVVGGMLKQVTFTVSVLVHENCISTLHGNRAICICSAIEDAMENYQKNNAIGKVDLMRLSPLLGLQKEYTGYTMQFRASGFKGL